MLSSKIQKHSTRAFLFATGVFLLGACSREKASTSTNPSIREAMNQVRLKYSANDLKVYSEISMNSDNDVLDLSTENNAMIAVKVLTEVLPPESEIAKRLVDLSFSFPGARGAPGADVMFRFNSAENNYSIRFNLYSDEFSEASVRLALENIRKNWVKLDAYYRKQSPAAQALKTRLPGSPAELASEPLLDFYSGTMADLASLENFDIDAMETRLTRLKEILDRKVPQPLRDAIGLLQLRIMTDEKSHANKHNVFTLAKNFRGVIFYINVWQEPAQIEADMDRLIVEARAL